MGMICALHSVSDVNIDLMLANPPLIWRLLAPDDKDIYLQEIAEGHKAGLLAKLFGKKSESVPQEVPDLKFLEGENQDEDLDKSWNGIHYCLNKTAYEADPPMDFITVGGTTIGNIDVGYGPARAFKNDVVQDIHNRLSMISADDLRKNYDPPDMKKLEIYPDIIWERDGEEAFEYLAGYFSTVKDFVGHCYKHKLGMIVYLC